jgi:O-antigen/teichoic acid export membrane protein
MSGVLAEINTRVDVLMLGYFCSDRVVGVYSFAAMLAEGAYQLPLVLKQNYNPLLVQVIRDRQWETLRGMTRKGRRFTYAAMFLVCGAGLAVFPLLARFARDGAAFMESWPVFALLIAGVFAASGYAPFGNILLQAHRPGLHTMMITAAVGLNALGNWALIPLWAAQGAALATAVSMAAWVLFLRAAARRALGVWI